MKFFFAGSTKGNEGPPNVNKGIVQYISPSFCCHRFDNKYLRFAEGITKSILCQATVASGVSWQACYYFKLAKLFNRKTVYIKHGDSVYESQVNQHNNQEKGIAQEAALMETADIILPVSEKYSEWVCERYPQYANKIKFIYNGVELIPDKFLSSSERKLGRVAAAGGDRLLKNNDVVINAVEQLNGKAKLNIYGKLYNEQVNHYSYCEYTGKIPQQEFWNELSKSHLFILNSSFETFGLAVMDALQCGCSILVSEIAGVTGILELEETDIIHNPLDVEELKRKIVFLLENPNNERIMSKIDFEEISFKKMVENLEQHCLSLLEK